METKKKNILFAIADDASHMSAYGHEFVNTPYFDWVASKGVLLNNVFTTNPKCAPSRATILTGMHTWSLEEASCHFGVFPSKFTVFPDLLEKAGYHIGFTGKGWGPGDFERGGFTRNPAGPEYNNRTLVPPENTGISKKDYAGNFEDFLKKRSPNKPFFFWYGGLEPHRKYIVDEGIRAGKKVEDVKSVPSYLPNDEIVKRDILDYAYEIEWFDRHLGLMIEKLKEIGELDRTLIIVTSDNGMPFPRVKGQMYEHGFHMPMAACIPGLATEAGTSGYSTSRYAASEPEKCYRIVDDLISFVDIAPTILKYAGIDIHPQMHGKSFLDIILSEDSGMIDPSRNRVYFGREKHDVGREGDLGYPVRCIRSEKYLYIRNFEPERWPAGNPETGYTNCDSSPTKDLILKQHEEGDDEYYQLCFGKRPLEELYNIIDDPDCINNLASIAEYSDIKAELWNELKEVLEKTGDPRIKGNGEIFESYEYTGAKNHSWKAYIEGCWSKQTY